MRRLIFRERRSDPAAIARASGCSPLVAGLLSCRGIPPEEAVSFLRPDSTLRDPFTLSGMEGAVARIRAAAVAGEKILVYGDYDADGVTASAVMHAALRRLGADADFFIPERISEGYGMKRKPLEKRLRPGTRLVITLDNGITAVDEVDFLRSKKIDTIIVDHHEPKSEKPRAFAIVDGAGTEGARGDDKPAACALAFKLAWALAGNFEAVRADLDLVAIGTIADVAPLCGENRAMTRLGLAELSRTRKKGLQALLKEAGIRLPGGPARATQSGGQGPRISSRQVAFLIAPRINAAGRVASASDAFSLLVTENDLEAANLAQMAEESNRERQKLERAAFREAVEQVAAGHHFGKEPVIVVADGRWHEGVVGIVAARLAERFARPAFVIAVKEGIGKGSGRSVPGFLLFDALERSGDLFESFGGHQAACGMVIREEKIPDFRRAVNEAAHGSGAGNFDPCLEVDAEVGIGIFDAALLAELEALEPHGQENPEPLFLSRNLRVKSAPKPAGGTGCSFWVEEAASGAAAEVVFFRRRLDLAVGDPVDIVYRPRSDERDGIASVVLRASDVEPRGFF